MAVGALLLIQLSGFQNRPVLAQTQQPVPSNQPPTTNDQINKWMTELSNWGRWGKDDQLGTLNLITAANGKPR